MESIAVMESVFPGVWKLTLGQPEPLTPMTVLHPQPAAGIADLPEAPLPFDLQGITWKADTRSCVVHLPLGRQEHLYGFGLQLKRLDHTGRKVCLRVNSDPVSDTGDSHAPVPFYVSTAGYGVYVDTARYVSFYCGSHSPAGADAESAETRRETIADNTDDLYTMSRIPPKAKVVVDIPAAKGVDIYVFAGPDMKTAVRRYNLFSGGGCLPPLWGLGVWYRIYGRSDQSHALELATQLRQSGMPCDVLGFEPGWHSHSYSCSYRWDPMRFPEPKKMQEELRGLHFRINLWEHAFVHPSAPFYNDLQDCAGDTEVWGGLVPDLATEKAAQVFGKYHKTQFIDQGISGFKLDECDNSDYNVSNWSFPEYSAFPSGLDGEQMHSLLGMLYQRMIEKTFRQDNRRTLSQVRSSGPLAASEPFVLYSDLYDHRDFIRGVAAMGFSGLLWSPEVRSCRSAEDLIRRLQSVVFSPQALINAWTIPSPPWVQLDFPKDRTGSPLADPGQVQKVCRRILEMRMSLLPYLYHAFATYHFEGTPPFRALAMDYPLDKSCVEIDDEYLIGDSLLAAPLIAGETGRYVYLPGGDWCDFFTGKRYTGGKKYTVLPPLDQIPLFVRYNSLIPWANPVPYVEDNTVLDVTLRAYGSQGTAVLFEDDGVSFDFEKGAFNRVTVRLDPDGMPLVERTGHYAGKRYRFPGVELISH